MKLFPLLWGLEVYALLLGNCMFGVLIERFRVNRVKDVLATNIIFYFVIQWPWRAIENVSLYNNAK